MLTFLAQSVVDTAQVEWVFAHWIEIAIAGLVGWLGWRNRELVMGLLKSSPDETSSVHPDWIDETDHRAALFAALCLLNDHAEDIGDDSAKAACKALMPSVMTACEKDDTPTEEK